ncbi:MAG TPA: cyclic nucleotide-binding domain-containing protein [Kiloniellales bacterium]|nr:cyclic nucleotide-binding domain-containing protein [Kiloniellales bacterium]
MSIEQEVEILRKIPLFSNVDPAKLKLMCFASERLTFKEGQPLFEQGEPGDSAYIIVEGSANVIVNNDGPVVVAEVGKNDIVGEIAILCDVPRTATIKPTSELTALRVTKDLFFRMITDFPEMGVEIMRVLAQRLEKTTAQLLRARAAQAGAGNGTSGA